jgi:hypothetical protein
MSLRCQSRIQIIGVSLHGLQVDGNELFGDCLMNLSATRTR